MRRHDGARRYQSASALHLEQRRQGTMICTAASALRPGSTNWAGLVATAPGGTNSAILGLSRRVSRPRRTACQQWKRRDPLLDLRPSRSGGARRSPAKAEQVPARSRRSVRDRRRPRRFHRRTVATAPGSREGVWHPQGADLDAGSVAKPDAPPLLCCQKLAHAARGDQQHVRAGVAVSARQTSANSARVEMSGHHGSADCSRPSATWRSGTTLTPCADLGRRLQDVGDHDRHRAGGVLGGEADAQILEGEAVLGATPSRRAASRDRRRGAAWARDVVARRDSREPRQEKTGAAEIAFRRGRPRRRGKGARARRGRPGTRSSSAGLPAFTGT